MYPTRENAWHAGDGSNAASGNRTSIAIEICESGTISNITECCLNLSLKMLLERWLGS
ncbi:N-acetylmuramoyl-L-alanine amidase [Paenibacillus melissococcoides]|nr:N-acetylmuramoyl-L-alanine amidase [Paenibacillus melissococcoides]